ncbi:MAG: HAMP domain-containing sensor histidine kinase [Nitriliruptorales bacterium]|nr:HAMP domain-containing sensor histidine kinase [Nitriliruptorales bacterium]
MIPRPPRRRLARRLLAAHGLVIAAGAVTLAVVALLVSPPLFHRHVGRALGPVSDAVARHLDQALTTALLLSLGIGVAAAIGAALAVSWVLSSRIARPIEDLSDAAKRLEAGELSARAPHPPSDDELADLTKAFNDMAGTLEHVEDTRRRLLNDLAHELRTPLSTIEGYLEGLADGVVSADAATWQTLRAAAARLHRLVDDIGLVSRAEEGRLDLERRQMRPVDAAADAVAAAHGPYLQAGVDLRNDVSADLPRVSADPDRIQQVLANLLDNARRHTSAGGQVIVSGRRTDDGDIAIDVTDTGEGIDPDNLPHLFERFYRGDRSRRSGPGSGIGLTIARAIARAHGGDLTARSDGTGRGATFTLVLPLATGDAEQRS